MDFQKNKSIILFSLFVIFLFCLILFFKPLFSNEPLGLDTLGHLSKVSYLKEFGITSWDMSWYSGTLSLKLYSPLFYYILALFPNVLFGANFLSFLSILFTCFGIYLLLRFLTGKNLISLIFGISFLTVLSISYYWIATGNLPYFFALWTIPFSLYFLERSIKTEKKKEFVFFSLIFAAAILIHVIIGFLVGIFMIFRLLFDGFNIKNIKKIIICGLFPVLLSSFWFIPFLAYSINSGVYSGYVPSIKFLFGFDQCCWGLQAGGVGILAFLFIPVFLIFLFKKMWNKKILLFNFVILFVMGFLLLGGLGNNYPFGVDPVRFVLPFSIALIFLIGLTMNEWVNWHTNRIKLSKILLVVSFIILIIALIMGLYWSYNIINKNFNGYSYYKEGSRYQIIQEIISNSSFPISNEFTNYRFGTSRYVFGETINYFMPAVSHTLGYQDRGMLNLGAHEDFLKAVWESNNISQAIYYLDWFGIKYFEGTKEDSIAKFKKNNKFKVVNNFSPNGYAFSLFEYLDAKPIISLVDGFDGGAIGKTKDFNFTRKSPDEIEINYGQTDDGDVVIFKEFYHKNWHAKEVPSGKELNINQAGPGFMSVQPSIRSTGVEFYYKSGIADYSGIFLTLLGIILLFFIKSRYL